MAPIGANFVQIVKTFQLSDEAKSANTTSKVCDRCRKNISDQSENICDGSSNFSRRDFQSYIYQSSSRKVLLSYTFKN